MKAKKITIISTLTFALFICITAFTTSTKKVILNPQDDLAGIYVDGYKVDKISCYSFQDLKVMVPYNSEWSQYDFIKITVRIDQYDAEKVVSLKSINSFIKGKYLVFTIFEKENLAVGLKLSSKESIGTENDYYISKARMKRNGVVMGKSGKPANDAVFEVTLQGLTFTNETEEFNNSCNCILKTKIYTHSNLNKVFKVGLTDRVTVRGVDPNSLEKDMDLTTPCTYTGPKVDFNNLGKSGSSSNNSSNTNTTPTNNTPVKAETPVKTSAATGKTVVTIVAPTSAASVKPLDKTKPGYFEEKSEDKKYMYRNGYQKSEGIYHGEVREYDNNQLYKIIIYTDGIEDGLHIIFDDGKVSWTGNYKNGKKDGAWKHFKDGMLEATEKYVDGEKQD